MAAVIPFDDLKTLKANLGPKIAAVESRLALVKARLDAKIDARFDKLAAILDTQRWVLGLHMAMIVAIVVRLFAFS